MSQPMDIEQYKAARPARISQGTAIEQSRAASEVYASVLAAQQMPRVEDLAVERVKVACGRPEMAKRAFYSFNRGDGVVAGPTIALAKEAARCWGNVHYGLSELLRDGEFMQSEMQAWAWDLETNQRVSSVFIVPHARWAKGASTPLVTDRDIYEHLTNSGSRRLREMIFAVLPDWFVDVAKEVAMAAKTNPAGVPLPVRIANMIDAYDKQGVSREQLEAWTGSAVPDWTAFDAGQVGILWQSISNGEITKEEAFPPRRVSDEDIRQQSQGGMPHAAVPAVPAEQPTSAGVVEDSVDGRSWPQVAQPGSGG